MSALEMIDVDVAPPTPGKYHRRCRRRRGVKPAPAITGVLRLSITLIEQKPSTPRQDPEESVGSKARRDELMAATFGIFKNSPILMEHDLEPAREMHEE
jgi:hypothetical protein